jgi:hypothetical protein
LHEASLCGTGKRPAVPADSLRLTAIALALLQEACFRGARERLALPAHGSALAGSLRGCRSEIQRQQQCRQKNPFHVSLPFIAIASASGLLRLGASPDLVRAIIFGPFRPLPQVDLPACTNEEGEQEFGKRRLHFRQGLAGLVTALIVCGTGAAIIAI